VRRVLLLIVLAAGTLLAIAAPASAAVLAHYPGTSVACGAPIRVGVKYVQGSGGRVTILIRKWTGAVVWRLTTDATTTWRFWDYYGRCGAKYKVAYSVAGADGTTLAVNVRR
jgi:hypothetical protein